MVTKLFLTDAESKVEAAEIAALNHRVGALVIISFVALNALLIVLAVRGG